MTPLAQALSRADVRLGLLRRAEPRLLEDPEAELEELAGAYVDRPDTLRAACRSYHLRRTASAETLASLIERVG